MDEDYRNSIIKKSVHLVQYSDISPHTEIILDNPRVTAELKSQHATTIRTIFLAIFSFQLKPHRP